MEARNILRQTVYNMPADGWSEAKDGLFGAVPDLNANKAASGLLKQCAMVKESLLVPYISY